MTIDVTQPPTASDAVVVRDLTTQHHTRLGRVEILERVSLRVGRGRVLGLVGESGCGKSTLALALAGLLPRRSTTLSGSIVLDGQEIVGLPERQLRRLRGSRVGFVPQDPMHALNPAVTVGRQLMEAPREHLGLGSAQARRRALELLEMVRLPRAESLLDAYPYQLSGGMRQRVMIAIAMSCRPALVVADEPTTALDVTVQAEILRLFRDLCTDSGSGLVMISHDLNVVSDIADDVAVIYAGEVIEQAPCAELVARPAHPYTRALLDAVPDVDDPTCRTTALAAIPGKPPAVGRRPDGCRFAPRCALAGEDECASVHLRELREVAPGHFARTSHPVDRVRRAPPSGSATAVRPGPDGTPAARPRGADQPILTVRGLTKTYRRGRGATFAAVSEASLSVLPGQTYGLVGESGSGKSTLAHCVTQLIRPYDGEVVFDGEAIQGATGAALRSLRRRLQIIFQDARNSLNSRMPIGAAIAEPLRIHRGASGREIRGQVRERLDAVGLPGDIVDKYPRQCSGGELQRVCIARALILQPRMIVCDEAVTSLDVSSGAQVINLLRELQEREGLALLFISHDFATIRAVSDVIGVMRDGVLIEQGPAGQIFDAPGHDYTRKLLSAVPRIRTESPARPDSPPTRG